MSRYVLSIVVLCAAPTIVFAGGGATFLGPTPYTSQSQSPFDLGGGGFCLEDFESAALAVAGVTGNGSIVAPGSITDSVDGDDGSLDGSGLGGHSYFGDGSTGITFTFDPNAPAGLPTQAGMVWTDGSGTVTFEVFGLGGASLGTHGPFDHPDATITGETPEDRFYGATAPGGISAIRLTNTSGGIEVDHLQFDHCATATTSTTTASTTTTSIPPLGSCESIPDGPSFRSIECRLTALLARVSGESRLVAIGPKLAGTVDKARARTRDGLQRCLGGDVKRSKKKLKQVARALIQYAHRLRGLAARKRIGDDALRESFIADGDRIRPDVQTLKGAPVCADA